MSTFMSSVFRRYFNPRSPRGGATKWGTWEYTSATISIHAPHEGERPSAHHSQKDDKGISIHAPHEGERQNRHSVCSGNGGFQSTLPTRGSDQTLRLPRARRRHFNPRSPRGGATGPDGKPVVTMDISIHAPHEGERQRKSAFVYSISANLLNIIHCGTVTRAVSRRRIALFRLFSVRRSGVFMYAYASH